MADARTVEYDTVGGRLRLPRPLLHTLAACAVGGPPPPAEEVAALESAGILVGGRPHVDLAELAQAVANPVVTIVVDRLAPAPAVTFPGWLDGHLAVFSLPQPDGSEEISAAPVTNVMAQLAGLTGLGPRPPATGHPPVRPRLHWRVTARWGTSRGRSVEAIDGGERGWWLVRPDGETVGTTATDLFRRLAALLPGDEDF